jgi:integrase/recombinase XerC
LSNPIRYITLHRVLFSPYVGSWGEAIAAGTEKVMSPHRIRHSVITAALDATNGDTRKVQKLSRHRNLNTLMIYDDNRHQHQSEVTNILADLV